MMTPSAYVQQLQEAYSAQPQSRGFVPLGEQLLKEGFSGGFSGCTRGSSVFSGLCCRAGGFGKSVSRNEPYFPGNDDFTADP